MNKKVKKKQKPPMQSTQQMVYNMTLKRVGKFNKESEEVIQAVKTLLKWSGEITEAHIANRGGRAWTIHEQLCHNISEIGEVYEAIRQTGCVNEIMEEMIDILFSSMTNINIFKITRKSMSEQEFNKLLNDSIRTVFKRVTARVNDAGYKVEG